VSGMAARVRLTQLPGIFLGGFAVSSDLYARQGKYISKVAAATAVDTAAKIRFSAGDV
jgi:hypothetical protein